MKKLFAFFLGIVLLMGMLLFVCFDACAAYNVETVTPQFCQFYEDILFLKPDGTLWFYDRYKQPNTPNKKKSVTLTKIWDGVKYFEVEGLYGNVTRVYMITTDNVLYRLDFDGGKTPPTVYEIATGVKAVHASYRNGIFAVKEDNNLWYWGNSNFFEMYEKNETIYASSPYLVAKNVKKVGKMLPYDVAFIKDDNTLWGITYYDSETGKKRENREVCFITGNAASICDNGFISTGGSLYSFKNFKEYERIANSVVSASYDAKHLYFVTNDGTLWYKKYDDAPVVVGSNAVSVYGSDNGYVSLNKDGWLWRYNEYYTNYYYPEPLQCVRMSSFMLEGNKYILMNTDNIITATYYDENGYQISPYNTSWSVVEGQADIVPQNDRVTVKPKKGGYIKIKAVYNPTGEVAEFDFYVKDYSVKIDGRKPIDINEEAEITAVLYSGDEKSSDATNYEWEIVEKEIAEISKVGGTGNSSVTIKGRKKGIATVKVTEKYSGTTEEFKLLVSLPPNIKIYTNTDESGYGITKVSFNVVNEKYPELDYSLLTEEEYESLTLKNPKIDFNLSSGLYAASGNRVSNDYTKTPSVYVYEDMTPASGVDFSYNFAYGDEAIEGDDAFFVISVSGDGYVPCCKPINVKVELPVKVIVNGEKIEFDALPILSEGRTLVPVRKIFNALGAEDSDILWDNDAKKVTAVVDGKKIELFIDSTKAYVNGEEKILDVPARILPGNRTYVPVRFIAESFGAKVHWNQKSYTVSIISGQKLETENEKVSDIKPDKNGEESGFTTEEKEKWFGSGETYNVYKGGEVTKGTYQIKNLVIKEPLTLPANTKICVSGYLNIENKVSFGYGSAIYVVDGDVNVKKNGILDMSQGGTLECENDFIFNSGTNHSPYLTKGTIVVGGDVILKKNFCASGKNEFHIANKQELHVIDVRDEKQHFNILNVRDRGFEVLDIKKEFDCETSLLFGNWDVLKDYTFENCFELAVSTGQQVSADVKARVETGVTMALLSESKGKEVDLSQLSKLTKDMKLKSVENYKKTYKYYDDVSGEFKEYTLIVNYFGVEMMRVGGGYGLVTYIENGKRYDFVIHLTPDGIEEMITGFKAALTVNLAGGIVDSYKSNYTTSLLNNAKNVMKSTIIERLPNGIKDMFKDGEDIKNNLKYLKEITDLLNEMR